MIVAQGRPLTTQIAAALVSTAGAAMAVLGIAVLASPWIRDQAALALTAVRGTPVAVDWARNLRVSGVEFAVDGVLLAVLGVAIIPRWQRVEVLLGRRGVLVAGAEIVLAALWLPVIVFGRSVVIGGERYWWLGDDAMISMRYARNLADGVGLVSNPGERVEGYTNFLWTAYMAMMHLFPIPESKISLVVLLTNIALAAGTIPVLVRVVRTLGGQTLAVAAPVLGYALSIEHERDVLGIVRL